MDYSICMFNLILQSAERNYSSRGIEKACNRDINYMYLLEGRSAPDHATIARFRSIHFSPVAEKYLSLTVNYLMKLGEIGGNEIFANCNNKLNIER